jgi:hypothetical protein
MQTIEEKTLEFIPSAHVLIKPNHKTFNTAEIVLVGNTCVFYIERCTEGEIQAGLDPEGFYWATWTRKTELTASTIAERHPTLDSALTALGYKVASLYGPDFPWCADATGL